MPMSQEDFDALVDESIEIQERLRVLVDKILAAAVHHDHPSLPGFTPVKPVVDPIYFDNIDSDIRPVRSVTLGPDAA